MRRLSQGSPAQKLCSSTKGLVHTQIHSGHVGGVGIQLAYGNHGTVLSSAVHWWMLEVLEWLLLFVKDRRPEAQPLKIHLFLSVGLGISFNTAQQPYHLIVSRLRRYMSLLNY